MPPVGNRIRERRKELGLSVDDVAEKLGKNRATVYRYESNDIENMPASVLEPLADLLHTTPAYLMGWEDDIVNTDNVDDFYPSQEHIRYFMENLEMSYDEALKYEFKRQNDMQNYMDTDSCAIIPLPKMKKVPLLGKIACGEPITAEENIEDYVEVPDYVRADFALTCQGDSMINARINNGDIVYIRQEPEVENGEIAAVLIDGDATLKRVFYGKGSIMLQAENPAYAPMIFSKEEILDVRILGKATYFLSRVK